LHAPGPVDFGGSRAGIDGSKGCDRKQGESGADHHHGYPPDMGRLPIEHPAGPFLPQSLNKGHIMSGTTFAISDVVHTSQPERNDVTFSRAMKRTPISARLILSTFLGVRLPWSMRRQRSIQHLA
jgi:hypothetical protein